MPSSGPIIRPILFVLAAGAVALLGGCGSDDAPIDAGAPGDDGSGSASGPSRPWIAGDWILRSVDQGGSAVAIPADLELGLSITGPDRIEGDAGCNRFAGVISAPLDDDRDGGALAMTDLAQTEMACEHLDFEVQYTSLLASVDEWELAPPDGLVFRGEGIELTYSVASPATPVALEGTRWTLDTIFDGDGVARSASTPRMDMPEVVAVLGDQTMTLTSDDCGPVEVAVAYEIGTEGSFRPIDPGALAGCDDPDSNMEAALAGVNAATGYQIVEHRLTLIGLPGETVSFTSIDG